MYRAYGTPSIVWSLINRLKSVVTKCPEPTALKKAYIKQTWERNKSGNKKSRRFNIYNSVACWLIRANQVNPINHSSDNCMVVK
jgi:hypothetical protein